MSYQQRKEYQSKKEKKKKEKIEGHMTELEILENLKKANRGQGGGPKEFENEGLDDLVSEE